MVRPSAEGRRRGEALSLPRLLHNPRGSCEKRGYLDGLKPTRETPWAHYKNKGPVDWFTPRRLTCGGPGVP